MILSSKHELIYATTGSAGFDIPACIDSDVVLTPGGRIAVPTGIKISSADYREYLAIVPRSGLAIKHGITVLNAPGTVDSDYPDEIKVILINHSHESFVISPGMRIAQGIVCKHEYLVGAYVNATQRHGGFGSTGNQQQ